MANSYSTAQSYHGRGCSNKFAMSCTHSYNYTHKHAHTLAHKRMVAHANDISYSKRQMIALMWSLQTTSYNVSQRGWLVDHVTTWYMRQDDSDYWPTTSSYIVQTAKNHFDRTFDVYDNFTFSQTQRIATPNVEWGGGWISIFGDFQWRGGTKLRQTLDCQSDLSFRARNTVGTSQHVCDQRIQKWRVEISMNGNRGTPSLQGKSETGDIQNTQTVPMKAVYQIKTTNFICTHD